MAYTYTALDSLGKQLAGVCEADSRPAARSLLQREGLQVLTLEDDAGLVLFPRRISKSEIIYTTTQLAIMVDTGISLAQALAGLEEQEENPTLAKLLGKLRGDIEAGDNFSAALGKYPKYFDRTFVALIKSAEETGALADALEQIATYMRKQLDNLGKVRAALAYPAIMLVLAIGVTVFLLTYAFPKFTPIFNRRGIELPAITSFMIQVSDLLAGYWYLWTALVVALAVGFFFGPQSTVGRRLLDGWKIKLPILGNLFRKVILSRSILTLGTMLNSGVALIDALRLTAEVSGNYHYEKAWLHVIDEVSNGRRVYESLKGSPLFPRTLVQMIGSGEETGRLDYVLKKVSVYYDGEVATTLKATTTMIEPLLIAVMGIVVGSIALSLLLPIFTLSHTH
jgi:type IV pilus assembly protein PilC